MDLIQWGITAVISILTFLGGRKYERQRLAQANRLELLAPVEEWIDQISKLIGIVGSGMTAINEGIPFSLQYGPKEMGETAKALGEKKEKVMGILQSTALTTKETRQLTSSLSKTVADLSLLIERDFLQAYYAVLDKVGKGGDITAEMMSVLGLSARANSLVREIHSILAELKTKYN